MVTGFKQASAERLVAARIASPFESAEDLARRAELDQPELKLLAAADALTSLSGHRRRQVWDAAALRSTPELLRDAPVDEEGLELEEAPEGEEIVWDYASTGLTLRRHPLALLRSRLAARGFKTAAELAQYPDKRIAHACGIVTLRQHPDTAKGLNFVSFEDETGAVQIICSKAGQRGAAGAAVAVSAAGRPRRLAARGRGNEPDRRATGGSLSAPGSAGGVNDEP